MTTFVVYSQQKINIEGKVTADDKIVTEAVVELQINKTSKFSLTDKKGIYRFLIANISKSDSLILKVKYLGFKLYYQPLNDLKENNVFDINLSILESQNLNEVVVVSKDKIINNARKSSYKISSKDFIKNASAIDVLGTVPNVNMQDNKATVDGALEAKIFIDGIETMPNELKTIEASSIDRVEVINNPSASFGTDFTGAVINIISKVKKEDFFKGSFEACAGVRNGFWYVDPSISYKRGGFTIKSFFEYKESNQKIDYILDRVDNSTSFFLKNNIYSKGIQQNSISRINVKLSDKSNLTFSNFLFGYKFISDTNGYSNSNNNDISDYFSSYGDLFNKNWNISAVFDYKINENKRLFVKGANYIYDSGNETNYNYSNLPSANFKIQSKNNEFSTAVDYEAEGLNVLKKETGFYTGLKFINRNYSFFDTNFYINQNIVNAYFEVDTEWSEKFATDVNISFENTREFNSTSDRKYNLLLPVLNLIYHLKNKTDIKFGYSRKVLRPSASDLNDELLIINPGIAKQGNSNLDPQIRNYYSLMISKSIKSNNLSLKFYNESINNAITDIYKTQDDLVVQTLENAAKYNSLGMSVGIRTKILKKVIINLNSGFDYNTFEDNSSTAIIKKNSGYTFRGNLNLNTKLFKEKLSVSLSGRQNGPNYSLLSKGITNPYLDFTLNTNLLKDKLNVNLYCSDLLMIGTNRTEISNYNNFYQKIDITNNNSNISLSLTYNFGKKFNDRIDDNSIQNNDVRR